MRLFASWWERVPGRRAAVPALLAVYIGAALIQAPGLIASILGSYWN